MNIECPNCHEVISLVGATELANEFGLKSNSVQHYRKRGFPEPVLRFGNRYVYLRSDVEEFDARLRRRKFAPAAQELLNDMRRLGLPKKEIDATVKNLEGIYGPLELDDTPPKKPTTRKKQSPPRGKKGGLDSA